LVFLGLQIRQDRHLEPARSRFVILLRCAQLTQLFACVYSQYEFTFYYRSKRGIEQTPAWLKRRLQMAGLQS
jgi:hypothetical protein